MKLRAPRVAVVLLSVLLCAGGCGGPFCGASANSAAHSNAASNAGNGNASVKANAARPQPTPTLAPDVVANQWVEAAFAEDGATLSALTCRAKQSELTAGKISATAFLLSGDVLIPGEKPRISHHNLTYSVASTQGDSAIVKVNGTLVVAEAFLSKTEKVKNKTMQMLREGGAWTWCGF